MNVTLDTRTARFVRAWTRFYTRGVAAETATARRAEIDSDLWEHATSGRTSLQVLGRWLLGVPADLAWRVEQAGAGSRQARESGLGVRTSGFQRGMLGITVAAALFMIGTGGVYLATGHYNQESTSETSSLAWAVWGGAPILAGLAIMAGVFRSVRSPRASTRLIAGGVVLVSLLWFWLFMITIPVGILIIAAAVARSRKLSQREAGPAA